jgi:hypothetical protein
MDPTLIILGIQATLRAAQAGAEFYHEHALNRNVFLPNLELPPGTRYVQLNRYLNENPSIADADPQLSSIWDKKNQVLKSDKPEVIDAAYSVMLKHKAKDQLIKDGKDEKDVENEAEVLAAGRMVEQWRKERQPPSALARMALTLTDIGLEFVGSNPSILGVGARGEKLIIAFAKNMSALIPDSVDGFGPKTDFADRVLGVFLRAGLGALTNNASTVFGDDDIAKLLQGVTKPIIDALPESIADQIYYRDIVDALAGPSAEAVFTLLAENAETYLGKCFADDKALGAVTSALFEEIKTTAHDSNIVYVFSEQGAIRLYQAGLKVAVERPGLFVGDDGSPNNKLFRDLLSGAAHTLTKYPRFSGPLGASLAAMAVEVIGDNAPVLLKLNPDESWEKVAITAMGQVATGLAEALKNVDTDGSLRGAFKSFTDAQLLEIGRVILTQVAKTPGMLGVSRTEVQSIVAGLAEAMAADEYLLLSADEWVKIAGIAVQKASSNPGRLFALSADDPGDALAVTVIKSVLRVAGDNWTAAGRSAGMLCFGDTLQAGLEIVIKALSGNVTAVTDNPALVDLFVNQLLAKASADPTKFGSDGLLKVLNAGIGTVLANGTLPDDHEVDRILSA